MHRTGPYTFTLVLAVQLILAGAAHAGTGLVISADDSGGNGTSNSVDDRFRIVRNGASLEVFLDGQLSRSVDFASLGTLTVNGSGDDDTLTVDF